MAGLAGLEPATFCLEDRRSGSAELQAPNQSPKSQVQCPNVCALALTLDVGRLTLDLYVVGA
jgi:hypothetical protein